MSSSADALPPAVVTSPGPGLAAYRTGLLFLLTTTVAWGLNWPVMKFLMAEWPPLSNRGLCGLIAAAAAFGLAAARQERLRPAAGQVPLLALLAFLNVTCWMGLTGCALLWLAASEAVTFAYTMPIWAAVLAWPLLGERPSLGRIVGLLLGIAGVGLLAFGQGAAVGWAKVPGIACALAAAVLFALGTVLSKRHGLALSPLANVAWQMALGTVPLVGAAALLETPDVSHLTPAGYAALLYNGVIALFVAFLTWFAALRRLPAGIATLGTLLTPIVGVLASALFLAEPLGAVQVAALCLTLGGVTLAARC